MPDGATFPETSEGAAERPFASGNPEDVGLALDRVRPKRGELANHPARSDGICPGCRPPSSAPMEFVRAADRRRQLRWNLSGLPAAVVSSDGICPGCRPPSSAPMEFVRVADRRRQLRWNLSGLPTVVVSSDGFYPGCRPQSSAREESVGGVDRRRESCTIAASEKAQKECAPNGAHSPSVVFFLFIRC